MPSTPIRRLVAVVATALALVVGVTALGGCSRSEFEDRTAVVVLDGSRETYEVQACGLDGQTVFVVAEASGGAVLQGVMGLEDDDKTGVPASTGLTVDLDPTSTETRVAGFGAEAWERRGSTGPPPGTIEAARLRGSRIQYSGTVVPVDGQDRPVPEGDPVTFSLDARCDEVEE